MKRDLEKLFDKIERKEVLITNTFEKDSLGYLLAHVIRLGARTTYCVDNKYKMTNEPEGYRVIENGKVVLIKADLDKEPQKVEEIVTKLNGKIDYIIKVI